jgi:hypothetical protein
VTNTLIEKIIYLTEERKETAWSLGKMSVEVEFIPGHQWRLP